MCDVMLCTLLRGIRMQWPALSRSNQIQRPSTFWPMVVVFFSSSLPKHYAQFCNIAAARMRDA